MNHSGSQEPFISVIVVTRDRSESLARALTAIEAQDYPNYETLVIDNSSSDDTAQVVENTRARYVQSPGHWGIGQCRQLGIDSTLGDLVAFCDDDCVPARAWLRALAERFNSDLKVGLIGGRVENVGFSGGRRFKGLTRLGRNGTLSFVSNPAEAQFFGNMNLACRREALDSIGGYDPFFDVMEEIDLADRLRRSGWRLVYAPQAVVEHHHVGSSYKRRHLWRSPQLIRLYFFFKNYRPTSVREWTGFLSYEVRLFGRDIYRWLRRAASIARRGQIRLVADLGRDAIKILSSRLALPWLIWRTNPRRIAAGHLPPRGGVSAQASSGNGD